MSKGISKYRKLLNDLDQRGSLITIQRVDKKCYNLIINGIIVRIYKQRQSCNNRIVKMHFDQNSTGFKTNTNKH